MSGQLSAAVLDSISSPVAFIHLLLKILLASVCRTEVFNNITKKKKIETCWNVVSFCCVLCAGVERDVVYAGN